MQCNTLFGLKLDSKSIVAIEDIKRRTNMTAILSKLLPFGVLTNIFLGNGVLKSSFNISQTDFMSLSESVAALSGIQRRVVEQIAMEQQVLHSGNERLFWEGVQNGCEL